MAVAAPQPKTRRRCCRCEHQRDLRRRQGASGCQLRGAAGRSAVHRRRERQRQEHADQGHHRRLPARAGRRDCRSPASRSRRMSPAQARAAGVEVIWQDLALFPEMTRGREYRHSKRCSARRRASSITAAMRRTARRAAGAARRRHRRRCAGCARFAIAQRQIVAIARALVRRGAR